MRERSILVVYLILSLIILPVIPQREVYAQESESSNSTQAEAQSTDSSSEASVFDSEDTGAQSASTEEEAQSAEASIPETATAATESTQSTETADAQTSSAMSSQSPGSSPGADGTPNTVKTIIPDVDKTSGALRYEYPLKFPPGRNGVEPHLSLTYNTLSPNADSIFGYGWELSIPYIRHINRQGSNLMYSSGDFYESSFSGELISVPNSSTTFAAKIENGSFIKYEFATSSWVAIDKSGVRYSFGAATSTRHIGAGGSSPVYAWMLDEIRDRNGNYATYEYYQDQGQIYPSKIYYTLNGTSTNPFEIEFLRQGVSSSIAKYYPAFGVKTVNLISQIKAKFNGTAVRTYSFEYASSTTNVRTVLDKITESGEASTTTTLPAVDFDYQGGSGVMTDDSGNASCPASGMDTARGTFAMDVNGDGWLDFAQSTNSVSSTYLGNGDLTWSVSSTFNSPLVFWSSTATTSDQGIRTADINGDGKVDLLQRSFYVSSTVYLNTSNGWSLYSGSGWSIPEAFVDQYGLDRNVRIFDINGDGLPDIIRKYTDGTPQTSVYLNDGTDWVLDSNWSIPVDNLKDGIIFADINNDGLMDLLQSYRTGPSSWAPAAYLNNGNYTWAQESAYAPPIEFSYNGTDLGVREADINGDGYSDLIQAANGGGHSVYLNVGTGWATSSAWSPSWDFVDNMLADTGARLADYNGDGLVDKLDCNNGIDEFYKNPGSLNPGSRADLMVRIKSPFGGASEIKYKPTPKFKSGSTILNPELSVVLDAVERITKGDGINPTSTTSFVYQGGKQYFGNVFDRKMAGFAKVVAYDNASNTTTSYFHQGDSTNSSMGEYSDDSAKIGKAYLIERADSSGNIFNRAISRYEDFANGSSSFVMLTRALSMTYDGDSDHKDSAISYTYSTSTGNLSQKIEWGEVSGSVDGSISDIGGDLRTTDLTYASNTAAYIFAPVATEITTNASSSKVKESRYYYDAGTLGTVDKGNITKIENWISGSSYVSSTRSYNDYGLPTQETNRRSKTTSYSYDPYLLRPATTTNALSQSVSYQYDYPSGQVVEEKDANGLMRRSRFDGLGRLIEELQPDLSATSSLVTRIAISYTDSYGASSQLRTNYLNSGSSTTVYTYVDGFGRTLQTRLQAEASNTFAVVDTAYNTIELLDKESLPYFSTGSSRTSATTTTALYTSYTYDAALRIATTTTAVGSTYHAYDDWKNSITDARGKIKHFYADAFGNLSRVDETNNGSTYTTSYEYDALDNLTKIIDASGNLRNFTYDGLSRRLTAQDLHAAGDGTYGSYTYAYDEEGNLTETVDPKSQTVDYSYDALNRVLTENYTGGSGTEQSYSYDSCLLGVGKLCTASSSLGVITSYQYNGLGGTSREVKTVSSTSYQTDYTYDRQGNLIEITNSDNSSIKYLYNTAGKAEVVQWKESGDSYTDLVSSIDYGPHGKPVYRVNANCTATTHTYDPAHSYRLTSILTEYICSSGESSMMSSSAETQAKTTGVTPQNFEALKKAIPASKKIKSATSTRESASSTKKEALGETLNRYASKVGKFFIPTASAAELYNTSLYTDPSLISYWRLEGTSTSTNGLYNGTDTSVNYSTSSGKYGKGANFVISNNSRIVTSGMGSTSTFSVVMWAKLTSDYSGLQQDGGIWGNNDGWNGYGQPYAYLRSSTNNPNTSGASWFLLNEYGDNPDNASIGSAYAQVDFNDNLWHHVVVTYDSASTTEKYYVDGTLVRTNTYTSRPTTTFNNFTIGSSRFGGSWRTHGGDIDDVAVFGKVLSASEVYTLYSESIMSQGFKIQSLSYSYDNNGNIVGITDASNTSSSKVSAFSYDDLNRLFYASTSQDQGGAYTQSFSYDAIGNITSSSPSGAFVYGSSTYANPHAATSIGSSTYSYDNNGNLTGDGVWTHTWDYRNRLTQSVKTGATSTYLYDTNNGRVRLITGSTTTVMPSAGYSIENGEAVKYVSVNGELVASIRGTGSSSAPYWIHSDHLGSKEKMTDMNGEVVELSDYYPFGSQRQNTGSLSDRKGFLSKDVDPSTSLNQLGARYFKSDAAKFISQDPVFWEIGVTKDGKVALKNPQLQNSYSYANNNPTTYSDPEGRMVFLGSRPISGPLGLFGAHAYVYVIPNNPSTIGNIDGVDLSRPFTLGGYTDNQADLYKQANNPTDLSRAVAGYQPFAKLSYLTPPEGMTQEGFDRRVVESYNGLPSGISNSYGFTGQIQITGNPNSNNVATSILAGAGVSRASINDAQRQLGFTTAKWIAGLGQTLGQAPQATQRQAVGILQQLVGLYQQLLTLQSSGNKSP